MSYNPDRQPTCRSCGRVGVDSEGCPGQGPHCGACKICKKRDHTSQNCPITCFLCGKKGHKQRWCPAKRRTENGPFGATSQPILTLAQSGKRKLDQHLMKEGVTASTKMDANKRQYRRWSTLNVSIVCPGRDSEGGADQVRPSPSLKLQKTAGC